MSFNEAALEEAIIEMLGEQGYPHIVGEQIERSPQEVLIKEDLQHYLSTRYAKDGITEERSIESSSNCKRFHLQIYTRATNRS